jgi:hypothetical protein
MHRGHLLLAQPHLNLANLRSNVGEAQAHNTKATATDDSIGCRLALGSTVNP